MRRCQPTGRACGVRSDFNRKTETCGLLYMPVSNSAGALSPIPLARGLNVGNQPKKKAAEREQNDCCSWKEKVVLIEEALTSSERMLPVTLTFRVLTK